MNKKMLKEPRVSGMDRNIKKKEEKNDEKLAIKKSYDPPPNS